jgi:hypothetical protein
MTIPASRIARINPSVISGGGNPLAMNGLYLTQSLLMPTGSVFNFASVQAVINFFGPASPEAAQAAIYFAGYTNSSLKPGGMLFAAFNLAARAAFLQSGSLAGVSLTQLQTLSGTLTITVDGTPETSAAIDLSAATSFTNAAALIVAGFTTPAFAVAWHPVSSSFVFTSTLTGTAATVAYATGTLAASLNLTKVNGAILSQGAAADTPVTAMTNAINQSQNWVTFLTMWEPVTADKLAFLTWSNGQNNRYAYLGWDSDANASVQGDESCFGALATAAGLGGGAAFSGDPALALVEGTTLAALALNLASFVAGSIASINFAGINGRRTVAFLSSGSIQPTCADDSIAENLLANGYSFYGSYATANQTFIFLNNGQMFGAFKWLNSYVQQIYLNSQFQLVLMNLLTQVGSIPYNPFGFGMLRNTLADPIAAAIAFGTIRIGVTLSAEQTAIVNQAAGVNAASVIQTQGYYLQILDPGAQARTLRQSPIINFWYADGDDIQQITMSSTDIL